MTEDLYEWGRRERLPKRVINSLMAQGIISRTQMIQQVSAEVANDYFLQSGLLSGSDCLLLTEALKRASSANSGFKSSEADVDDERCTSTSDDSRSTCSFLAREIEDRLVTEDVPKESLGHHLGNAAEHKQPAFEEELLQDIDQSDTVRLLLLGKTGSGKSTTGNTILGQRRFDFALNFGSVTSECERRVGVRGETRFEIMDSPGLYDTHKTHEEICTIIVQATAGMHPGPHAVLYVIRVGRFTEEDFQVYERLKVLFDVTITHHMILLFTHGDLLEREGRTLADMLHSDKTPGTLKQVLSECGNRCLLFNNEQKDSQPMVDNLLQEVRGLGGQPYVCPKYCTIGQGMDKEVAKRLQKYEERNLKMKKYVQNLQHEANEAKRLAEETQENFLLQEDKREMEERKAKELQAKKETQMREQLRKQQEDLENNQKELQRMKEEREKLEAEATQRETGMTAAEKKQRKEAVIKARERETTKSAIIDEYKRELERQQEEARQERRRMEEERRKMQRQYEDERRKEIAENDRRQRERREREKRRKKAEAEQNLERERQRRQEMEQLKRRVVEKEDMGFFEHVGHALAAPFKALAGLFS